MTKVRGGNEEENRTGKKQNRKTGKKRKKKTGKKNVPSTHYGLRRFFTRRNSIQFLV